MKALKLIAIILIVGGTLGLIYGGFSYTEDSHSTEIGSVKLSVDETEHVDVPIWAGIGSIVIGGLLFIYTKK